LLTARVIASAKKHPRATSAMIGYCLLKTISILPRFRGHGVKQE
jgi:hypothetical protein